jgi:hypothetical protein
MLVVGFLCHEIAKSSGEQVTAAPIGQITSPNQKSCQALATKISFFRFSEKHD